MGMTTATVKAATRDDIDAVVASAAGLFLEDGGQHDPLMNVGWPAREGAAYYAALVTDRRGLLVLAWDDDRVAGHLAGRLSGPSSIQTECLAVLESMRVAPDARRSGVGGLLVAHFFAWARQAGARQASVTAYAANETARNFYAQHGFVPHSVTARAAV
jgi:GNAT superfamily N-acetyltransferase